MHASLQLKRDGQDRLNSEKNSVVLRFIVFLIRILRPSWEGRQATGMTGVDQLPLASQPNKPTVCRGVVGPHCKDSRS